MRVSVISPLPVRAYCNRLSSTIAYKPPCGFIAVFAHTAISSPAPLLIRQRAESFLYLRHALQTSGVERYIHLRHGAHSEAPLLRSEPPCSTRSWALTSIGTLRHMFSPSANPKSLVLAMPCPYSVLALSTSAWSSLVSNCCKDFSSLVLVEKKNAI